MAVSICLTAVLVACRGAQAPAPPVPPPAHFVSTRLQPKPVPPAEREMKVLPLDAQTCTRNDTTLLDFTNAEVLARCDSTGPTTRVLLTVLPRTTDPADYFRAMSLRFCGEVINVAGPAGWKTEVERETGRSGVAADVTWKSPDAAADAGMRASGRISGFAVTLRGQWRRGLGYYVAFGASGGSFGGSPHDCPYPFR